MIDKILSLIAPHHCCGCGEIGSLLCPNCKYDITSEPFELCIACGSLANRQTGVCRSCRVPYQKAWCVGERSDSLQRLIGDFKFQNARSAHIQLTDLLDDTLPQLPADTIIIPIPTVRSHIRERGYDHMLLIARRLAKRRGLSVQTSLQRATSTKQRGIGRRERIAQAKIAFRHDGPLNPNQTYLIIDDVVTTGATLKYAAITLQSAGAKNIWVASVSRQPSLV